ncbi:MAG: TetR/AcrR family transcriptional regulator [Treponema sp.]|nr:TetR/AcrR family transcriptional regulator [Treponema sp.]
MGIFARLLEAFPPQVFQAAIATFTFSLAYFHRLGKSESPSGGAECWPSSPPPDHAIEGEISLVRAIITHGIGLEKRELEALDYEALEKKVSLATVAIEEDKLLHAVAEAVAGAGPWGVSMEMVACISGLSKSGLYAHFKSKRDMLVQVFVTEFDRIIDFAEESMKGASAAAERLYLAIFAICDYLRSRPDIIIALDWLRTRRFMLSEKKEQEVPSRIYRIFGGIRFSPDFESQPPDEEWLPAWILFLIVNSLMTSAKSNSNAQDYREWIQSLRGRRQPVSREKFAKLPNETFRNLYRFIARGIQDFTPQGDGRALAGQL